MKWIILDFGTHETKALKVEMDANRLEILDFADWPSRPDYFKGLGFPESTAWSAATIQLNELDWLNPEEEVYVSAALPSAYLETRYLKFPFRDEKKIEKVLTFELEAQLPFDIEDLLLRHRVLEGEGLQAGKKETVVLCFSYKRDQIKTFETELRKFQISMPPLTAEILALSSLRQAITTEPVFALLECGHSKSQLLLLQRAGGILASRTFLWGGERIIQNIASEHSLDFAKAEEAFWQYQPSSDPLKIGDSLDQSIHQFVLELRQTLKGLSAQHIELPKPLPVFVVGGLSKTPDFLQKIEKGLGADLPASVRPFPLDSLLARGIHGANRLADPEKAITVLSIALSQLRQHRGKIPAFSESGFQFQQNLKKLKSSSFSILRKVALLLIAPFLYSLFQFYFQEKESRVIIASLTETLGKTGLKVGEISSTDEIVKRLKKERAANRQKIDQLAEDQNSPLVVLTDISNRISTNLKIDVKDFKVSTSLISVTAETTSAEAADAIVKSLKELYPSIKMGALTACGSKADCKSVTFEIEREIE